LIIFHVKEPLVKRRLPPLKALPAFEIAARQMSFSKAAEELHLTHGAISRQMKALEGYLGVALFRRLNRRIELTESGVRLLPAVQTALDVIETSSAEISVLPRRGPLVISCLPTLMMRWLIPRLYDFYARYPEIEVRLAASYAPVNFRREGIDVAIRFGAVPPPEGIEACPFLEERIGPVCSPAVLKRHDLRCAADLRRHTLLHTDSRPDAWPHWVENNGVNGLSVKKGPRFEHFYYLLEAAAGGLGVALAPYPFVAEDLKIGRLVAPLGFTASGRSYYVLHPKEVRGARKIEAFRSWIVDAGSKRASGKPSVTGRPRLE
jgi:LysR family glycine cleavage system transcriptional activator